MAKVDDSIYKTYENIMSDNVKFKEMLSDIVPRIPEIVARIPSIDIPWKTHLVNMYNSDPTGAASMLVLEVKMNQLWSDFFSVLRLLDMENIVTKWFPQIGE